VDHDCYPSGVAYDSRKICMWPPIDLVARLRGSHGISGVEARRYDGTLDPVHDDEWQRNRYDAIPPRYSRRLLQWWAWILPGYTVNTYYPDEVYYEVREPVE